MAESTNNSEDDRLSCKILIIGAGMAGLSAATHLLKNNETDFLIVEARGRIGGRIIAVQLGNEKVELGANWIHGVLGNPMFELAMANGLIDIVHVPKPHKVVAALEDGKQLPFPVLREIYEAYVCFLRRCEEYFLSMYSPPDGITSVGAHIALEAEIYLSSLPPEQRRVRQLIFDCLLKRETCVTGCDSMDDVDLLEMGSYDELQGGNISLPNGYSVILEPVSKHIPKDRILTKHAVTKIRWHEQKCRRQDDVGLTEKSDSNATSLIKVQCENGKTITAEHVICTLPLGVLKRTAQDMFEPSLPAYKLEAINRLMFGTVNKIFLEYERPFLNPGVSEVMLLWDDERLSETEKRDIGKTWFRKIYSFIKISDTLLLGWISGRAAEYMEKLSTTQVAEVCTTILRRFLNDPFVPTPKNCLRTTWHSQPYTRGSYTAMAVGASQLDIRSLAEPLVQEKTENETDETVKILVAFAGEHTHSSFYSTVHGAYLTGRTAADVLLGTKQSEKHALSLSCEDTSDLSSWIQDTVKSDNNDSCRNSSPCPELTSNPKSIENSATDTKESTMECENNVDNSGDTVVAATLQEPSTENIDFTVIYNKQKISVNFAFDGTVAELKTYLQKIISVPQAMQKVMFKGLAKDDQTLRNLGVTKGAKVMIVGSKLDDVLAVSIPTKQDLIDEAVSSVSKEPLSQQKVHRKVLDKGIPEDVMPGILDSKEPLPEFPLAGMLNKSGGKVRLTFKLEQDQLWIGTKERTDKIPMNSIKGVHSEPIHDHPEYHVMAIQLGTTEASRYWIYWVPAQYISAIKDAILGKWCYF